jgi:hypothetical protein
MMAADRKMDLPLVTAGDIAAINLQSARRRAWSRFWQAPERPGIAEHLIEQEHLAAQFLGDLDAFDRLETLVYQLAGSPVAGSVRTALMQAQVASMTHRFAEARDHLAQAEVRGAPPEDVSRLTLAIDQACGSRLDALLKARSRVAAGSGRLEDLVPLGALLADLGEYEEADRVYSQALREYQEVSPFAVAWTCFQLGTLWGELACEPELSRATLWYRQAIDYLPCYVKARVHLAEILLHSGQTDEAEALLTPALSSGDPEVSWRLSDVLNASGKRAEAEVQMRAARSGFDTLLEKHLLAFADHGAEFYSGSGNNVRRALELARVNLANRPTLRAFQQAYACALSAHEPGGASDILAAAVQQWGGTPAFAQTKLAEYGAQTAHTHSSTSPSFPTARGVGSLSDGAA